MIAKQMVITSCPEQNKIDLLMLGKLNLYFLYKTILAQGTVEQ